MNIANRLTLARVFLIPVFILLLEVNQGITVDPVSPLQMAAGIIFILASVTDYLDGYLARKLGIITNFGVFFDPMADKLLVIAALVYLTAAGFIPAWSLFIIVGRELMITGLRVLLAQSQGQVLAAALPGKIKTFSQMFAIIFFIFADFGISGSSLWVANCLFYFSLVFTIYSGLEYFYKARFLFKDL